MIFTDRTITVKKGTSSIDDTIVLYRGDKEVEIRFTLNESSPFRFGIGAEPNIIEKTEAAYGQLVIKTPNDLPSIFSEIVPTNEGKIIFTITAEMIDEITEVGNYTFQIRLLDESMNSRATLPEVVNGIEIREPIATEDTTDTNEVGIATVGYALTTAGTTEDAFDTQGNYNKTTWVTGDRITAAKLNKIEAGIDGVNQKVASGSTGGETGVDLSIYQTKTDNTLNTTNKTVSGAINELNEAMVIAEEQTGDITVGEVPVGGSNKASDITITDTAGNYTSNNVEGALQEVGSQIKEKANKNDVVQKGYGTLNDFDENTRKAIQGMNPIDVNAVLGYKNVKPENTSFIQTLNYFNKDTCHLNQYLNSTGDLREHASYNTSDFIILDDSLQWFCNTKIVNGAFYDSSDVFIAMTGAIEINNPITKPSNARKIRFYFPKSYDLNKIMFATNAITTFKPYAYKLDKTLLELELKDIADLDKLQIEPNQCEFFETKNLFDKNTIEVGKYVNNVTGALSSNATYSASAFIEVEPNSTYSCSYDGRMAFYREDKSFISGQTTSIEMITPDDCKYIRITVGATGYEEVMLIKGVGAINSQYSPYGEYKIPNKYLDLNVDIENVELKISDEIQIALGRTIEIYDEQILPLVNINNYYINYKCNIGQTMRRKWTCTPTMVGSYNMLITVYDLKMNKIASKQIVVRVVNAKKTNDTILIIGDSNSDRKTWQEELKVLNPNITYIGTRGNVGYANEGYSGFTIEDFTSSTSSQIEITVSGISIEPTSKKVYLVPTTDGNKDFEVETCDLTDGNGKIILNRITEGSYIPLANGTITSKDSSGSGDVSISYSKFITKGNPFCIDGSLDFNAYLTNNNFDTPTHIFILLGTNNVSWKLGDNDTVKNLLLPSINEYKTLVDTIKTQLPTTEILIGLIPYWANQNGLGVAYGNNFNDIQFKMNVSIFNDLIKEQFKSYTNVKFVPLDSCFDREYGYGQIEVQVNPRVTTTIKIPSNGVHASYEGYLQWADIFYSTYS